MHLSVDRVHALGALGTVAPLVFTLDWLLLGLWHRGYDPSRETISSLSAHDATGWPWMVAGQISMAAGALAVALLARSALGRPGAVGAAFMALACYGIVQASVFRTICNHSDSRWCMPLPRSAFPHQQWLHGIGTGVAFASLLLGCLGVAWAARRARLMDVAVVSAAAGLISVPLVAWFLSNAESALHGFAEKLFLLTLAGWAAYTSHRLAAAVRA